MTGEIIIARVCLGVSPYTPMGPQLLEYLQLGAPVCLGHSTGSPGVGVAAALPPAFHKNQHLQPDEDGLTGLGHLSPLAHSTRRIIGLFLTHPDKIMPAWLYPEGRFWRVRVEVDADGAVQKAEPTMPPHPTHSHHHHDHNHERAHT